MAVKKEFPHALPTIGPVTDTGFYYDIDFGSTKIGTEDLEKLEKTMRELLGQSLDFRQETVDSSQAKELFKNNNAKVGKNVDEMMQLFVAEELWIAPLFSARVGQAKVKGAPVEFVIPKEGGMSWIYQTGLIANRSPERTELSEKLVNMTLDPERQIEFAKLTGYPPTNRKAMAGLPASLNHLMLTEPQLQSLSKLQQKLDYMAMFGFRDQYTERWNKEVLAGKA